MPPRKPASRKHLLVPVIAVLVVAQVGLMAYLLLRKKGPKTGGETTQGITQRREDPLSLYVQAQKFAASRQYLEALDSLASAKKLPLDQHLTRLTADLERRVRFELQLSEALRLIKEEKWRPASHLLASILEQDPNDSEAKRLQVEVKEKLDAEALASVGSEVETDPEIETPAPPDKKGEKKTPRVRVTKPVAKKVAVVRPAAKPGHLSVASTPIARVSIDGVLHGFTPLNSIALSPGEHTVVLTRAGYRTHTAKVAIVSDDKKAVDVQLVGDAKVVAKVEPKVEPKAKVEPKVEPKKAEPKLAPIGYIPTLPLPSKLTVTNSLGAIQRVCGSVEAAVQKGVGRPAAGLTASFSKAASETKGADVTLFPRTMGYLIAQAMKNQWSNGEISQMLVSGLKTGRIENLAKINWRP